MYDDDLMPNDSEAMGIYEPEQPEDVVQADRKEITLKNVARPFIEEVLQWFDQQIAHADTIVAVQKSKNTYACSTDEAFVAHYVLSSLLHAKRSSLSAKFLDKPEDEA